MEIKVKYHNPNLIPLKYIGGGKSDWVDLRCGEDEVVMKKGEFRLIKLGVSIKLPEGYEAIISPRSSTFKNFGILQTNSIGVVDESYCGDEDEWMLPALAVRDTKINFNDRIAQFRIFKHQPLLDFITVSSIGSTSRGGIGSTGKE